MTEIEQVEAEILALTQKCAILDQDYTVASAKYNDGRINEAQHNFYYTSPRYLHSYYEMTSWYWRCVSVLRYSGQISELRSVDAGKTPGSRIGVVAGAVPEHSNVMRLDNLQIEISERMIETIKDALRRADADQLFSQEDVMESFMFCCWKDILTPADVVMSRALSNYVASSSRCAVYGSIAPIAETICLTLATDHPVTTIGPLKFRSAAERVRCKSLNSAEADDQKFDLVVIHPTLSNYGTGMFGEGVSDGGSAILLKRLSALLAAGGKLVFSVPITEQSDFSGVQGYGRCYDTASLGELVAGFEVLETVEMEGERPLAFGPASKVLVVRNVL